MIEINEILNKFIKNTIRIFKSTYFEMININV
jgi:hypothetical protein